MLDGATFMSLIPSENLPGEAPASSERPGENAPPPARWQVGPVTLVLIAVSVVATLTCGFGKNAAVLAKLAISEFDGSEYGIFLPEVKGGQLWRLLTPIFVHFNSLPRANELDLGMAVSAIGLVFNMLWLKNLGTAIEKLMGSRSLLWLVAFTGIVSNLGQFMADGPIFGGMSGVVYGLLGYIWMKARFDPASGFRLPRMILYWMLGWLVLCMTGLVGNVANFAHLVGLMSGAALGGASARAGREPRLAHGG
jgi:GlpG protein